MRSLQHRVHNNAVAFRWSLIAVILVLGGAAVLERFLG